MRSYDRSAGWILLAASLVACGDGEFGNERTTGGRIEQARFTELGGVEQWTTLRGDDVRNPILLLVHGGPGDVQSPLVSTYAPYERDFVLVQWDQRGAGRTFGRLGEATPDLTLPRLVADGIELTEQLRERFPDNPIVVLGHSWGTAIATGMVRERPDLFAAYVGTGQIASWAESVQWQFDYLEARARATNDSALLHELHAIGTPDPTDATQYFAFTRSLRRHFNAADSAWLAGLAELALASMSREEFDDLVDGMTFSGTHLLPYQMQQNLSTTATRFEVPYHVIQGRDDLATPTPPARAYFERVAAPHKEMVVLERAGHFALVTHREEFLAALRQVLARR